jgi:hypothetical protein
VKWLFGVGLRDTGYLAENLTLKYGSSAGFAPFTSQPAVRQLDRATSLVVYMQIEQTRRAIALFGDNNLSDQLIRSLVLECLPKAEG